MRKIISLLLTVIYTFTILPAAISFAASSAPDITGYRTVFTEDFEDGDLDSPLGLWSPESTSITSDGSDTAIKLFSSASSPTLLYGDPTNGSDFSGKNVISFKFKVKTFDHTAFFGIRGGLNKGSYTAQKTLFKASTDGITIFEELRNSSVFAANTEYEIKLYWDSSTGVFGLSVGDEYFEKDYSSMNFDFEHMYLRIACSRVASNEGEQEMWLDDFTYKSKSDAVPVITLVGGNSVDVVVGEEYTEPGYSANYTYEGDITSRVVVGGTVNTSAIGQYTLTYDVTAEDGTKAVQVIRTVNVIEPPVIPEPFSTEGFRTRVFEDFDDKAVNDTFTIWNPDLTEYETYGSGFAFKMHCSALTKDPTFVYGPAATGTGVDYSGKNVISFKYKMNNLSQMAYVALKQMAEGASGTIMLMRTESGTVKVMGDTNNTAFLPNKEYTIKIYIDADAKTIGILIGSNYFEKEYPDVDFAHLSFRIQLPVTTSETTQEVWIDDFTVIHTYTPELTLKGGDTVIVRAGSAYNEPGYEVNDLLYGDISDDVVVEGGVNTSAVGTYTLSYSVTNKDNMKSNTATRKVIVKPVDRIADFTCTADSSASEYPAHNLFDGDFDTEWQSASDASTVIISGTCTKAALADSIGIVTDDLTAIDSYTLQVSDNGTDWENVALTKTVTSDGAELEFDSREFKHFKLTLTKSSSHAAGHISIKALEAYVADQTIVDKDASLIDIGVSSGVLSKDLLLKTSGSYGSSIKWTSSNTKAISNSGTLLKPSTNSTVYMTATVTFNTGLKELSFGPFEVPASSTSGGIKSDNSGSKISIGSGSTGSVSTPTQPTPSVPTQTNRFSDVPSAHWAYAYIEELAADGVISAASSFEPERSITREEFLKILFLSFGLKTEVSEGSFTDVASGSWAAPYIYTAQKLGIINGISETQFGLGSSISRQDMAVMTVRILKLTGVLSDDEDVSGSSAGFIDSASISSYAHISVGILADLGIIGGNPDGSFNPQGMLSRAESAKIASIARKIM